MRLLLTGQIASTKIMLPSAIIFAGTALPAALAAGSLSIAGVSQPFSQTSKCDKEYQGLSYKFSATRIDQKIQVSLELLHSEIPRSFSFLVFNNDKQVKLSNNKPFTLNCKEKKVITLNNENKKISGVINVLVRELPIIPKKILSSKAKLSGIEPGFINYITDRSDFKTFKFTNTKLPSYTVPYKKVQSKLNDGYIFFNNEKLPAHVYYTKESQIDFGIYFSDVASKKPDTYTIVCLVNDKQIEPFQGFRSWSGELAKGQGIILKGKAKLNKGWNQLRCIALNNIYNEESNLTLYPSLIRSSYIYLE